MCNITHNQPLLSGFELLKAGLQTLPSLSLLHLWLAAARAIVSHVGVEPAIWQGGSEQVFMGDRLLSRTAGIIGITAQR